MTTSTVVGLIDHVTMPDAFLPCRSPFGAQDVLHKTSSVGTIGGRYRHHSRSDVKTVLLRVQLVGGVCSFSSLPDNPTLPRCPTASISSMKKIDGARLCAASNRSHTLAAPAPTNISTNLDPVTARNGSLEFAGTALACSVFRSREVPPSAHPEDRWPRSAQSVMGT